MGAGAQDFANGLAGGGGSYGATGEPEETIIGGAGGFGGGGGVVIRAPTWATAAHYTLRRTPRIRC